MIPPSEIEFLADREALARRAAEMLLAAATERDGDFTIALSGGSTPRGLYEVMAGAPYRDWFPWDRMQLFWGDERFVPHGDARSNYRMVHESLLSRVPIPPGNVHSILTEGVTPVEAALAYERTLKSYYGADELDPKRALFDVALLGLGEDGHIASLFPGTAALSERDRWVVAVTGAMSEPRITLTYPALESSRRVIFLVAGEEKRAIFERIRRGDEDLPATRFRPAGTLLFFVDGAAAG